MSTTFAVFTTIPLSSAQKQRTRGSTRRAQVSVAVRAASSKKNNDNKKNNNTPLVTTAPVVESNTNMLASRRTFFSAAFAATLSGTLPGPTRL